MEDLIEKDIQKFVEGKFTSKKGFRELEQIHPQDARKLVTDLVTKAQGVFLWVSVGVNAPYPRMHRTTQPLGAITLWLADDDKALQQDINLMTDDQRTYAKRTMKRRLDSRTRGRLEVTRDGQVDYLHRSVRDWTGEMWREIQSAAPDFDPYLPLLKALTVEMSQMETWVNSIGSFPNQFWKHALVCLYHAFQVRDDPS
ncbi:hypothetical protein LQW54_002034 [Pestalotiopsis sp. IQ-011]